jgi:hypothetical protein
VTLPHSDRPWYISDRRCAAYHQLYDDGVDVVTLQLSRILTSFVSTLTVAVLSIYLVEAGGGPTVIGIFALVSIAAINGMTVSEILANLQVSQERQGDADE